MHCKHSDFERIGDADWCITCGALSKAGSAWAIPARQNKTGHPPKWWRFSDGTKRDIELYKGKR